MRCREVDSRIINEERLFCDEVLYPRSKDRPRRRVFAKGANVGRTKWALPHESLVPHPPEGMAARELLVGLWQRERDPTHVLPAGHELTLSRSELAQPGGVPDSLLVSRRAVGEDDNAVWAHCLGLSEAQGGRSAKVCE